MNISLTTSIIKKCSICAFTVFALSLSPFSYAQELDLDLDKKQIDKATMKKSKLHDSEKEELMSEISFLAKKLLDSSGKDSLVLKSPSVMKPFIGVCSKIISLGIELTCISPASQAQKSGLKTGDVIIIMNGLSMAQTPNKSEKDNPYWDIVHNMKTGDVIKMGLLRGGKNIELEVTVGAISHPAYELKITR